jgi:putative ABC transport system permease protein
VSEALAASRLLPADILRVGASGLRSRRLRAALSALGVAIGIASMVAVLGVSESSKADLLAALDRLGTNLLEVSPGQSFTGDAAELPEPSPGMVRHMRTVDEAAAAKVLSQTVRRTDKIDEAETGGITIEAADTGLAHTLGATLSRGTFLTSATARYPTVVLGRVAARTLGIDRTGVNVWLGDHWFTVVGIMRSVTLDPDLDSAAFVGFAVADRLWNTGRSPTTIYVRADEDRVGQTSDLLGTSANPEHPEEVNVSRPSDALAARAAAKSAFTALFLGLGAVALLVGGVGIANVMVISVLERRSEIGLRRALGATRRHIAVQFLTESVLLGAMGGAVGALIGVLVTAGYDANRGWALTMPAYAIVGALACAVIIGALAGAYPALRGAQVSPTTALRTA